MKRLTKIGLAYAIVGILFSLKGSSPFVTTAISPKSKQGTAAETEEVNPRCTAGTYTLQPAAVPRISPHMASEPILAVAGVFIVDAVVNNTDPEPDEYGYL